MQKTEKRILIDNLTQAMVGSKESKILTRQDCLNRIPLDEHMNFLKSIQANKSKKQTQLPASTVKKNDSQQQLTTGSPVMESIYNFNEIDLKRLSQTMDCNDE